MTLGAAPLGTTALGGEALFGESHKRASGFTSTSHGSHTAIYTQIGVATGIAPSTSFGLAAVLPGWVPGVLVTNFGTPTARQHWNASSLGVVTRIPLAYYAFSQTCEAEGHQYTLFGTPVGTRTVYVIPGRTGTAAGFAPVVFGTPNAATSRTYTASGATSTQFGTPASVVTGLQAGFAPVLFGTPSTRLGQRATGWRATVFGTASARMVQTATGLAVPVQFGAPTSSHSRTYLARTFGVLTRFGRPSATRRFNYPATGFTVTSFGTPAARQGHRVTQLAPVAVFGTPLLVRSTTC